MENVVVPAEFMDKHLFTANHAYAMVYLYALRFKSQGLPVPALPDIAKTLGMKKSDVEDAVAYWAAEGYDIISKPKESNTADKSQYTPGEISGFIKTDGELSCLYAEAQKSLGKTLSTTDIQTLFWLYDYLGLSTSMIMLIINYAVKQKKASMRYIEKTAIDWAEKGISTVSAAEQHLADAERARTYEFKILKLLGIARPLTPSEKEVLHLWESELKPPMELIICAYEVCVERKDKLSVKYMNGILKSWLEKGYKTKADVEQEKSAPVKQTKFSNFTPKQVIDYKRLEQEDLQKRLGEAKLVK